MNISKQPQRLKDMRDEGKEATALAPRFIRAAMPLDRFTAPEIALLRRKALSAPAPAPRMRKLVPVLCALLLFVSGGVVGAALSGWQKTPNAASTIKPTTAPSNAALTKRAPKGKSEIAIVVAPPLDQPAAKISPRTPKPDRHRTSFGAREEPKVVDLAAPATPQPNAELQSIQNIYAALKLPGDANKALRLIESHAAAFPTGAFDEEISAAQVQAYMLIDNKRKALQTLQTILETSLRAEQRLLRAELMAELSDCGSARADFTRVYETSGSATLRQRALIGRASCWRTDGHDEQAHKDFLEYLVRFPEGPHVRAARAAITTRSARK